MNNFAFLPSLVAGKKKSHAHARKTPDEDQCRYHAGILGMENRPRWGLTRNIQWIRARNASII